jgi:hypothetical protein
MFRWSHPNAKGASEELPMRYRSIPHGLAEIGYRQRQTVSAGGTPMEMSQIRYALAASRTLNFTRAAEDCHVTQPALTKGIKALEAELGAPLFLREGRRVLLSDFGRSMIPHLRQIVEEAEAGARWPRTTGSSTRRRCGWASCRRSVTCGLRGSSHSSRRPIRGWSLP